MIFGEAPANRTASWHPDSNLRGSFNILSTCLITLGLCIWTAVHLNIPEHNRKQRRRWDPRGWITNQQLRKVGWLMMGVIAPEMVAFTAWHQRATARWLTKKINRLLMERETAPRQVSESSDGRDVELDNTTGLPWRLHSWTDVHSFYALIGGFAFDSSDLPSEEQFLPGGRVQVVLSPTSILFLAEHDPTLLPDLSKGDILDKSKANHLAKSIICIQASWFMVQTVTRLFQGLSISLLELNTFAHTICALFIFYFWWNKPLDIEEPTKIKGKEMHKACAFLCHWSKFNGYRYSDYLCWWPSNIRPSLVLCLPSVRQPHPPQDLFSYNVQATAPPTLLSKEDMGKIYMGQNFAGFLYLRKHFGQFCKVANGYFGKLWHS